MYPNYLMTIVDGRDDLAEYSTGLILFQLSLTNDVIKKLSTSSILHDYVKLLVGIKGFKSTNDMRVPQILHQVYFALHAHELFLALQIGFVNDLDGNLKDERFSCDGHDTPFLWYRCSLQV